MLLNEILDKPSTKVKYSNKPVSDILSTKQHEVKGGGAQALAYFHKKFPGKVIKTIQVHGYSDPSYQFLRLAMKHQDNPYFPKIYGAKMYKTAFVDYTPRGAMFDDIDPQGDFSPPPSLMDYTLYVVMEKLSPLSDITDEDLKRFGIERFVDTRVGIKKHISDRVDVKFRQAFLDPKWRLHMITVAKDPNLKEALRLLEPLFRHFEPDMHLHNIMLRGTQWVFIDPITHIYDGSD